MIKYRTTEIKWAIIYSLTILLWMLLERLLGLHSTYLNWQQYLTNLFYIPVILIYCMALKEKKRRDFKGSMTYLRGLGTGFFLTIWVTLLAPFCQTITSLVITPHYFQNVIDYTVEHGLFPSQEVAARQFNFQNYVVQSTQWSLYIGLVLSLVLPLFYLRKKSAHHV